MEAAKLLIEKERPIPVAERREMKMEAIAAKKTEVVVSPDALENAEDFGPVLDDDLRPSIPEGDFQAVCVAVGRFYYPQFHREAVCLDLKIFDGEHAGVTLQRFLNIRRDGRIGLNSTYLREWVIANQGQAPTRKDRMTLGKFKGKLFRIRVVTVSKAFDGGVHPGGLRYSKVGAILELLTTNDGVKSNDKRSR